MNEAFWSGKRVLVTGHTGFKGSWLCLWLQRLGAEVTGYALPAPALPNLFHTASVEKSVHSVLGDIRDLDTLTSVFHARSPEIVIHMAAQSLVRLSYRQPVDTYSINVMGTINVLEAVRRSDSVRAVVNVTSDKCYENQEWAWGYRENDPLGGYDPYSSSKGCAELVTNAYRHSFFNAASYDAHGVAVATGRAGNVIGGGDWARDRLIPDIVRALSTNSAVGIRYPDSIRPWQHVLEPLSGYLRLAEALVTEGPRCAGGWNFGPEAADMRPVRWLVERFISQWGEGASWRHDRALAPYEANRLMLDCSKARSLLGWGPRWPLAEAIDRVVQWHQAFIRGADMRALTLSQISAYRNR